MNVHSCGMKGCEICGTPARGCINGDHYCPEHELIGLVRVARLEAWRAGAPLDVIDGAERWIRETYEHDPQLGTTLRSHPRDN